ncbi:hypothetical protein [Streptomyces sp. NPDC005760]|uniref:hypothetical protein n=1 Tax=Streptomyces sp. NPDC005760 TaxID=3156718 RepID=UPI0033DF7D95
MPSPQEGPASPPGAPAPPAAAHPGFEPPVPGFGPPVPPPYADPQHGRPAPPPYPQQPTEGPEFMAVDRHNSIVVDSAGVAFEDHGHSAEFPWHEIRSVHYKAGPNGKTLMTAVVHLDGRFYECVVDAKSRDSLARWFAELAPVLGYYRPLA